MQIFQAPDEVKTKLGPCVATIGKYDGMHLGHQRILSTLCERARALDLPSLVILSEPQPEEFFSPETAPPRLNHFRDKVDFLEGFGIDAVLRLDFDARISALAAERFVSDILAEQLGVRVLVIGDDFRFGNQRRGDFALLQSLADAHGYEVISVDPCNCASDRVSSTLVRACLQAGDCARAAQLLGRPYSIGGQVVMGRQLGRQLGVPTANLEVLTAKLPMSGVFAVTVEHEGASLPGVANLGFKPTVSDEPAPSLEVHLLDYSGDLYGAWLRVNFLHWIRPECKFASIEELKRRIGLDIDAARAFHGLGPASGSAARGKVSA